MNVCANIGRDHSLWWFPKYSPGTIGRTFRERTTNIQCKYLAICGGCSTNVHLLLALLHTAMIPLAGRMNLTHVGETETSSSLKTAPRPVNRNYDQQSRIGHNNHTLCSSFYRIPPFKYLIKVSE